MDIDLLGMNGFEALDEIKKRFCWAEKTPNYCDLFECIEG